MAAVRILEADGSAVEGLGLLSLDIDRRARMTSSPIETGATTFDGKVIDPEKINVKCLIHERDYERAIKKISEMYQNRTYKFYSIISKENNAYVNYALVGIPHREDAEMIDAVEYTLTFQKAIILSFGNSTKNKSDQDTVKSGMK